MRVPRDVVIGTVIAAGMAATFIVVGGAPLIATFVPGVVTSWLLLLLRRPLPPAKRFLSLYFGMLGWQCVHFMEELVTGFATEFPARFGAPAFSTALFVGFNLTAYTVFALCGVSVFRRGKREALMPVLFFVTYGGLGNAIAHTWWTWDRGAYFPGFYSAQLYWLIGPIVLARLLSIPRSSRRTSSGA